MMESTPLFDTNNWDKLTVAINFILFVMVIR